MMKLIRNPRIVAPVTQDELAAVEHALMAKMASDALYVGLNSGVMARVKAGAKVEPGKRGYHLRLGVVQG